MICRAPTPLAFVALLLQACSAPFKLEGDDAVLLDSGVTVETGDTSDSGSLPSGIHVTGVVVDELGLPLSGVTLGGDGSGTTDTSGRFTLESKDAATLTFARAGRHTATRTFASDGRFIRVGLQPTRIATPMDADQGGVVRVAGATATVPPAALGASQLSTILFDPFDLAAGIHSVPVGTQGADGQVATVYAAVVVAFAAQGSAISPASAIAITLPVISESPGTEGTLLREEGGVWTAVGTAAITVVGAEYVASFTVSEAGTYAVGRLDPAGCLSGTVVDGDGNPAAGATVVASLRPTAAGVASYLAETLAAEDGSFCVTGAAADTSILVDYLDATNGHWSGAVASLAAGSADTCEGCSELGTVTLSRSGCATGNLYAADGTLMPPSPFLWEEGDFAFSESDSTLTLYARAGETFHLVGPGGLSKEFAVTSGDTVEAGTCTRLGNLQATFQCVSVDVSDSSGPIVGAVVDWEDMDGAITWSTTDEAGNVCLPSDNGTRTYRASWTEGAQSVVVSESVTIPAAAGTCQAGECSVGPSLALAGPGCVTGTILGERGVPSEGVTVWSSSWDSTLTDASGTFALATAGTGVAAIWADGWPVSTFTDPGPGAECKSVQLFTDAGAPPDLLVAAGKFAWRINGDGSTDDMIVNGSVVDIHDIDVDQTANTLMALLNVYVWYGSAEGAGFDNFDYPSSLWSAVRISPDHNFVVLQGYGASNPAVWVYELDGSSRIKLSTTASEDMEGLAISTDSLTVASTRKDLSVEVTPVNGSRGPVTIASSTCAKPVWFDTDTVALACSGDAYLYEMDGSSSVSWLNTAASERIWAITSNDRVVYSSDEELHVANIDRSDDVTLFTGSAGTTFSGVRVSANGTWIGMIVNDPTAGVDVLAAADQAPYSTFWLTATPTETEAAIDWSD